MREAKLLFETQLGVEGDDDTPRLECAFFDTSTNTLKAVISTWGRASDRQVISRVDVGLEKQESKTLWHLYSDGKGHIETCFFDKEGGHFWVLSNNKFHKG